jgi:LPS-assembly lipoprotein
VRDAKGKPLVPATDIAMSRDMTYSDTQVLAKAEEEKLLYRDMQNDAAQQILRRMAAVK